MQEPSLVRRIGELALFLFGLNYFFRFYQGATGDPHSLSNGLATVGAAGLNTLADVITGLVGFGAIALVAWVARKTRSSPWRYIFLSAVGLPSLAIATVVGLMLIRDAIDLVQVIVWALPRYIIGQFDPYLPGTFVFAVGGICYAIWLGLMKLYAGARSATFRDAKPNTVASAERPQKVGDIKNNEADYEGTPLFATQDRVAAGEKARSEEDAREAYFAELDERIREKWGR